MSKQFEYGGVSDCDKCKSKDVPVVEYYTGGFNCFPCAGIPA